MSIERKKIKILHITAMYPSQESPALGSYVKSQVNSLLNYVDNELLIIQGLKGSRPYILAIPKILKKIYSSNFDIIHIHYGNLSSLVKLLYWGKTPIVTSYCGSDLLGTVIYPGKYSLKSLFFKSLNIFLSRLDTCSIVKSKILADKIRKARRVEIIPNGVDINQFYPYSKKLARNKIGLGQSNKTIILFPADPELPGKNYKLLQLVMKYFNQQDFQILTFSGNKINHEDVPNYFNAADLVVFTSLSEGSPNVIKEAMACNCNIYSTNCGDVEWLLKDVIGSQVLSYNVSEWVEKLTYFFKNKNLIGSDARIRLLSKKLDTEFVAKRIVDIYYSLIVPKK
jgi:glycosyltransferase involved in cell wall biosynthesis